MRSLPLLALVVAVAVLPACAQRGGAHGGFSGHGGVSAGHGGFSGGHVGSPGRGGFSGMGGFAGHSGFAPRGGPIFPGGQSFRLAPFRPGPGGLSGSRNIGGSRPYGPGNGFRGRNPGDPVDRSRYPDHGRGRGHDRDRDHHRERYISPYGYGGGYPNYGYMPWLGGYDPYLFDNGDNSDSNNGQAAPTDSGAQNQGDQGGQYPEGDNGQYPGGDYGPPPPEAYPPYPPVPPLPSQLSAAQPDPATVPSSETPVTLVFKDGRPPEHIHNYVLTRTTLYVQDKDRRNIPVDQLDLVATGKANQEAGVDFQVPDPVR